MKKLELILNIVHFYVYKADYRIHMLFNKINPFFLIHKLPVQKKLYEKKGIDIYEDLNHSFKDPRYGLSSIRAGGFMFILSGLIGIFIFCILTGIHRDYLPIAYIFIFILPFAVFTYYFILYRNKYLDYFQVFENKSKKWKKKWALISIGLILLVFLLVILGVYFMTDNLPH
jgi:hypothetical protein